MSDADMRAGRAIAYAAPDPHAEQPPAITPPFVWAWVLFLLLVGLAVLAIWLAAPAWEVRVFGTEAQGRAIAVQGCGQDEDGNEVYKTSTLFTDAQGQLFAIPNGDDCNNSPAPGETVSFWYLPTDPTSTLSDGGAIGLYLLTGLWLAAVLVCAWFFWRATRAFIRACITREALARLWPPALTALVILALLLAAVRIAPPSRGYGGPARDYHLGQTVTAQGRWAVTVQGAQTPRSGAQAYGTICLQLDITVRNIANRALTLNTNQFTLYDPQDHAISTTCSVDAPRLKNASLAAGRVIEGVMAYSVPASVQQLYLAFQPDPQNAANVAPFFWRFQATQAWGSKPRGEMASVEREANTRLARAAPASMPKGALFVRKGVPA
jgi:hypothetical protein